MPNPKTGTVTNDLKSTIDEYRKGKLAFAADETGIMHFAVGKTDMDDAKILENIHACIKAASKVIGGIPSKFIKKAYLAPTMGPSVQIKLED